MPKAKKPAEPLRIGNYEVYRLGFGTRTWCVRAVNGPRGAVNFGSKADAIAYARKQG